jgi:NADPH:quinone reductase-like Zn-dependent oxidoreductase
VCEELTLQHHADAITRILGALRAGPSAPMQAPSDVQAVGHRVVHGGERYTTAVRITPEVKRAIGALAELAPLPDPARNVIVSDKQSRLQYLTMEQAIAHCTKGISIWRHVSNDAGTEPDVVVACAGDIPTKEALAAVALLREYLL